MSFSINTNVASLEAQTYLGQTSAFQQQTIEEVTSGLRIVNSGNDAAGLAVANGYASDEAVLTQGIANANDGIGQLQTVDGGENNISQLLDRASTLATQSASGTFTGSRTTLNNEFQSVLQEINREAQAIGLNQGGSFAQNLSVFVGGGQAATAGGSAASAVLDGEEQLNLTNATVDAKSLGLTGVQVIGTAGTDIGTGSAAGTSVESIVTNGANTVTEAQTGYTNFFINGPGFSSTSGGTQIKLAVNLTGVTDTDTLVAAINSAITAAGGAGNQQATAFANANITASTNTDSTGKTQLTFSSSSSAFQVTGGDQVANALLGNFATGSTGNTANPTVTGAATTTATATETVQLNFQGAGLATPQLATVTVTTGDTAAALLADVQAGIAANATLAATGITASLNGANHLVFTGPATQTFNVQASGDTANSLGLGSYQTGASNAFQYNTITAVAAPTASETQGIQISVNGGATQDLGVLAGGLTEATGLTALNSAIQSNAVLRAAGLTAVDNGAGDITLQAATGVNFRLNTYGGTGDAFGFGASAAGSLASTASFQSGYTAGTAPQVDAQGENQSNTTGTGSDAFTFTALTDLGDAQTVTLSAIDGSGNAHSLNVSLTTANAGTIDQALATINTALQDSNDTTLQSLVAFKQETGANSTEGIRFASSAATFTASLGTTTNGVGLSDVNASDVQVQGATDLLASSVFGTAGTANISNATSAAAAVTALTNSVTILGNAQAAIGRGENQFQYAANLAQSQLTNDQAAESQIRDANIAQESANLTKASIQLQAGVAALAQANSAPQQLLTLLQGH
jgi:flagellin